MAAIAAFTQIIFASTSGSQGRTEFGSTAGGSTVYSTDPTVIQATSEWTDGWLEAVIANTTKRLPVYQDMNSVHYVLSSSIAYLQQEGVGVWLSDKEYRLNSIVKKDGTSQLFLSLQNSNTNHALTDGAWWVQCGDLQYIPASAAILQSSGYVLKSLQKITSSGTWTKPVGVRAVIIEVQASGGGGAGANTNTRGAGGGAGGYSKKFITSGLGATEAVTIGAGGAGGAANANGSAGNTSSFGSHASATGGGAGLTSGVGGDGGAGSSGDVNAKGMPGNEVIVTTALDGGGGNGGSTAFGGGGLGGVSAVGGSAAANSGAGGAGGNNNNAGGDGGSGIILVWEYA